MSIVERRRCLAYAYKTGSVSTLDGLTKHHQNIVRMIATGLNNVTIARYLIIEQQSVKNHVSAIYDAVGAPRARDGYVPRAWLVSWYWRQRAEE